MKKNRRQMLGQHFLKDSSVIDTIVQKSLLEMEKKNCQSLLEIGPGQGALTHVLLSSRTQYLRDKALILSETDFQFGKEWEKRKSEFSQLQVEIGDFLDLPESKWLSAPPLAVVSNLPYSAGTVILTRLARHWKSIPVMVLMFQAEVAQRIRAEVGSGSTRSLTLWIQNRWDVEKLISVPPKAFQPPPQVNSEVLVLYPKENPKIGPLTNANDEKLWESLLHTFFAHPRKMLRSSLPKNGIWREALARSGVDPTLRPEALKWEDWAALYAQSLEIKLTL